MRGVVEAFPGSGTDLRSMHDVYGGGDLLESMMIGVSGGASVIGGIGVLGLVLAPILRPAWIRQRIRLYQAAVVLVLAGVFLGLVFLLAGMLDSALPELSLAFMTAIMIVEISAVVVFLIILISGVVSDRQR
jgi:hypothetical protein